MSLLIACPIYVMAATTKTDRKLYRTAAAIVGIRHHTGAVATLARAEALVKGKRVELKVGGGVLVSPSLTAIWILREDQATVSLKNTSAHTMRVRWDDSVFVDAGGSTHRLIPAGVRLIDRGQSVPPTTIIANSSWTDVVYPADLFTYDTRTGWSRGEIFTVSDAPKSIRWMLAIDVGGGLVEYTFTFNIDPDPDDLTEHREEIGRVMRGDMTPAPDPVSIGATEAEVIATLGQPSMRGPGHVGSTEAEYMHYRARRLRVAISKFDRKVIYVERVADE